MTCSWRSLPSGVSRMARHGSAAAGSSRPFRSWPDEKCFPAPARITTRTLSSASALSKAASSSSSSAVDWALAALGRFMVTVATAPSTSYTTSATGQSQHTLADDVALYLVGAGEDRRGLVVEPGPLPGAVARVSVGAPPQRRGGTEHGHGRVVQALAHLAPVQLEGAPLGARLEALLQSGQRAPVVELEELDLDRG